MAKKKVTRKELLKGPDEFLNFSARAAIYLSEHTRELTFIGYVLLAGALVYVGVTAYLGRVDRKGQEAYSEAYQSYVNVVKPEAGTEEIQKTLDLFRNVMEGHGLSHVSDLALPQMAYLKFLENKYDEAISLYESFLEKAPDDPAYRTLTELAIASCHEAKGDFAKALDMLRDLSDGPENPFKEQAVLNLARVYRLAGQRDKAKATLKAFIEQYPSSPFLPIARAHLNRLP